MKKKNFKSLFIATLVCLAPILLGMYYYNKLPNSIVIHWDVNNEPNGYLNKQLFIFGLPILMAILNIVANIINDMKDKYPEANKKATTTFKWIIPMITVVIYIITIVYALGYNLNIGMITMIIIGIILIIMGNYIPKTKGMNYIKINNQINEKSTNMINRISGYIFIMNGFLFIITTLLPNIISVMLVISFFVEMIIVYIYSLNRK